MRFDVEALGWVVCVAEQVRVHSGKNNKCEVAGGNCLKISVMPGLVCVVAAVHTGGCVWAGVCWVAHLDVESTVKAEGACGLWLVMS